MSLNITELEAKLGAGGDELILKGVSININPGEVHVLMGPNGSGKSTLAKVLLKHHDYELVKGAVSIDGEDITEMETSDRARKGLFLASQYPVEVPGVNLANFLRIAYNSGKSDEEKLSVHKFRQLLREKLKAANLPESFMNRNLNEGFSGGEKKKCEILQLLLLDPKYVVLDETDSGLDVDAIKSVFSTIAEVISTHKKMGVLIITHYHRVFDYINPDFVHIFKDGRIVQTGDISLAKKIDEEGYGAES